ncbi:uncharacterized protein B4U80_05676 [Leptotrombidium deliense]|uniref:Adiponectin receptor protein-like protein n=1 Tax=Leptotrombidium deliense TaxID=299467 RepID=A0A443SRS3_9ACAR|nr:uncharacterized protein B4U80_05676 [Leptotrombidium deliense]
MEFLRFRRNSLQGEPDWRCLSLKDVDTWRRDNEYILNGYRPQLKCMKSIKSILVVHNETGSIWTHLIAALLFTILTVHTLYCNPQRYRKPEMCLIMVYLVTSVICFSMSCAFHTFSCFSEEISRFLCKLDYIGITMFIFGSFVPWLYYGFQEHLELAQRYIILVGTLAIICIVISCYDRFERPQSRAIRAAVFLAYGLIGILPATHFRLKFCYGIQALCDSFNYLCVMGSIHTAAAVIYALRIPERIFPGSYDYWFHSHQIFHSLVVIASLVHYHCIVNLIEYRVQQDSDKIYTYFPFNFFDKVVKHLY